MVLVYVIVRIGVKIWINFMSCSENGKRGAAECNFVIFATMSGIYFTLTLAITK